MLHEADELAQLVEVELGQALLAGQGGLVDAHGHHDSARSGAAQQAAPEVDGMGRTASRSRRGLYILPMLDALDIDLLRALRETPRAGVLELSRTLGVARGTVQSRIDRLERDGVVTGYGPDVDVVAAGFPVQAFVTLEIAQGALDDVTAELSALPAVLEAHATTGTSDVLCRLAAASHEDLQETLLQIDRSGTVSRSTSVIVLSTVVAPRTAPLLERGPRRGAPRAPAYRRG
ncbi:hypothetical protein GCM10017691_50110 [Pseudonocardia petroleophila]